MHFRWPIFRRNCPQKGFTIIELMMALVVLGVLLTIAVPSFLQLLRSTRLTRQINDLVADISLARSEAGARRTNVSICIATAANTCATGGSDWSGQRIIFTDPNANGTVDTGEAVIRATPALDGGSVLTAAGFSSTRYVTFRPFGAATSAGTFTLCIPGDANGRSLSLAVTGRSLVTKISTCS